MEKRLERIEDMVTQLISVVGSMNKDMQTVKSDVGVLKSDVSELKSDVSQLKLQYGSLEQRFSDFSDTTQYLMKKSVEHDRDIEVLKQRMFR